jgi:uncharacterized protein YbjT (DUF2867 family)
LKKPTSSILVTGATGAQGGAAARELLNAGYRVRILTRHPDARAASALATMGAEIAQGDMDDSASLTAAMNGVDSVFSVQLPDTNGTDSERRHGFALVEVARNAAVSQFIHTSVCEAGKHLSFPRWGTGYWSEKYWTDKWDVEEAVCNAGFDHWTVLKPAFMMDNFAQPKAKHMFPHLQHGSIVTALLPQTRMQLIAADDVGAFARAAVEAPARFDRRKIELAIEALTMDEVAATLAAVLKRNVQASAVAPGEALAAGLFAGWVRSQEWTNEVGYRADIRALEQYKIGLTPFAAWIERHAAEIVIDA